MVGGLIRRVFDSMLLLLTILMVFCTPTEPKGSDANDLTPPTIPNSSLLVSGAVTDSFAQPISGAGIEITALIATPDTPEHISLGDCYGARVATATFTSQVDGAFAKLLRSDVRFPLPVCLAVRITVDGESLLRTYHNVVLTGGIDSESRVQDVFEMPIGEP